MRVQSLSCIALHTWVVLESLFAGICIRNYSGLLSLAPPADFAGEWQWEACQGTRKGYPYYTTGGPAEPSYSRDRACPCPGCDAASPRNRIRQQSPAAAGSKDEASTPRAPEKGCRPAPPHARDVFPILQPQCY